MSRAGVSTDSLTTALADVAISCGYYDQAHLTREWHALAGCSPKSWIARELPFFARLGGPINGLMILDTCINLSFDGQCEAAFKFYERCLNGKITFMLIWGDSPAAGDVPTEWRSKIAHATLVVGNTRLQGSDPAPGSYESPRGFGITLNPSKGDAERLLLSSRKEEPFACRFRERFALSILRC